jgi:23S rRNA (pseudouridine1915-N3)-methyltransferase
VKILVIAFGKLKTPGLREAADYYLNSARNFGEIEEIELRPSPLPDKSESSKSKALKLDASELLSTLEKRTTSRRRVVLLEERGKACRTQEWADQLQRASDQGVSHLVYCVGSSAGFADTVRQAAAETLSLGPQTLPHELARVVLLEQIFRGLSVTKGHPYHNEG